MLAFQRNTFCVRQVDGGKSFGESSFVIKTDPEIKTLKPTTTSSGLFGGSSYKSNYSKSEMPEKKASLLAPNVLTGMGRLLCLYHVCIPSPSPFQISCLI